MQLILKLLLLLSFLMHRATDQSENELKKHYREYEMAQRTKQEMVEPPKPENKNSLVYMFKQQLISAWRPVPSLSSSIILYVVLAIFFIAIGVVMFLFTHQQFKYEVRYDNQCTLGSVCTITIEIQEDVVAPIYFYYGVTNFNQNQRFYATSKSETQLQDGVQFGSIDAARKYCSTKTTNEQMGWTLSYNGTALDPSAVAFPCGMIAYSFFNDTFRINRSNDTALMDLSETGISWPNDKTLYKNNNAAIQGIDVTSEHWLVWLRPAVTNNFFKLWGVLNRNLDRQNYTITINNNYPISFGQKWIKIAKTNVFGDNNLVLSIAYLVCGGISLIILIGFIIGKIKSQFK